METFKDIRKVDQEKLKKLGHKAVDFFAELGDSEEKFATWLAGVISEAYKIGRESKPHKSIWTHWWDKDNNKINHVTCSRCKIDYDYSHIIDMPKKCPSCNFVGDKFDHFQNNNASDLQGK